MSMEYFGFHIRFRDLSRGGIRTIIPRDQQHYLEIQNQLFQEVYNLAFTQQKKNKDIPEGGSKGALVVKPYIMPPSQTRLILNHINTTTSKKKADKMVVYQLIYYKHYYALKHGIDPNKIECHFGLLKRTAKRNEVEIFKVTSGKRRTENAMKLLVHALHNIDNKVYIKNRTSCGMCEFKGTVHCP